MNHRARSARRSRRGEARIWHRCRPDALDGRYDLVVARSPMPNIATWTMSAGRAWCTEGGLLADLKNLSGRNSPASSAGRYE